jgi:RNA polymerase sigma-70 factor, ECF subfamily
MGPPDAYTELVEPHRAELHAHAYRMLGSFHDAEDAVQEALVRAWRALAKVQDPGALRAWLYRIATNTSRDAIRRRSRVAICVDHDLARDPRLPDQGPDGEESAAATHERREELEVALSVAFALLPIGQRAVLIMRDALGFSASDTASLLGTTIPAVNSALARARANLIAKGPTEGEAVAACDVASLRRGGIVGSLTDAWERDDVEAVVALVSEQRARS